MRSFGVYAERITGVLRGEGLQGLYVSVVGVGY